MMTMNYVNIYDEAYILSNAESQYIFEQGQRVPFNVTIWTDNSRSSKDAFVRAADNFASQNSGIVQVVNPFLGLVYFSLNTDPRFASNAKGAGTIRRFSRGVCQDWTNILLDGIRPFMVAPSQNVNFSYNAPQNNLQLQAYQTPNGRPKKQKSYKRTSGPGLFSGMVNKAWPVDVLVSIVLWSIFFVWLGNNVPQYHYQATVSNVEVSPFMKTLSYLLLGFIGGPIYYVFGQLVKKFTETFLILASWRFFLVIGIFLLIAYYPVRIISRGFVLRLLSIAAKR